MRTPPPGPLPIPVARDERGFSLMEAIVGTVIATIAVIGLAYSFGTGRALIDRYEVGRAALGVAQARIEDLSTLAPAAVTDGAAPFEYQGEVLGTETWAVTVFNDPLTVSSNDLRLVTVTVTWGTGANQQSIALSRLFPRP